MPKGLFERKKQSPETVRKRVLARSWYKHTEETKQKIRMSHMGVGLGVKKPPRTIEHRKNLSISNTGKKLSKERIERMIKSLTGKPKNNRGERNGMYIKDRSKLKRKEKRSCPAYFEWQKNVLKRDKELCKMKDDKCHGRLEAHHIFRYRDYPELRYEVDNGITLCVKHHPRKRSEEERLINYFKKLICNQ